MGPAATIEAGDLLSLQLEQTGRHPVIQLYDPVLNEIVGSVGGVPDLGVIVECLRADVVYQAFVEEVEDGFVDLTVTRR